MNNKQIIAETAISAGIYTKEQVDDFIRNGKDVPLHTSKGWKSRGNYIIKKGEHGVEAKLWKKKENEEDRKKGNPDSDFFHVKAFLFSENQVEIDEE